MEGCGLDGQRFALPTTPQPQPLRQKPASVKSRVGRKYRLASPLGRFASYIAFGSLPGQGPSVAIPPRLLKRCLRTAHLSEPRPRSAFPLHRESTPAWKDRELQGAMRLALCHNLSCSAISSAVEAGRFDTCGGWDLSRRRARDGPGDWQLRRSADYLRYRVNSTFINN